MDTTKYDQKMAELRDEEIQKESRRNFIGRPKGPEKVVFKRNVEPWMVPMLDGMIKPKPIVTSGYSQVEGLKPVPSHITFSTGEESKKELDELKSQIKALLDDVAKLTKERNELLVKRENWTRATESQKVGFWIQKHDALKASIIKGEFDQSI